MRKTSPIIGGGCFIISFGLFYLFYKYVFYANLFLENCIGLAIWSLFIGFAFFLYSFLQRKVSLIILLLTYIIAFIALYLIFSNSIDSNENIRGLLTFIMIMLSGFVATLLFEGFTWVKNKKLS